MHSPTLPADLPQLSESYFAREHPAQLSESAMCGPAR